MENHKEESREEENSKMNTCLIDNYNRMKSAYNTYGLVMVPRKNTTKKTKLLISQLTNQHGGDPFKASTVDSMYRHLFAAPGASGRHFADMILNSFIPGTPRGDEESCPPKEMRYHSKAIRKVQYIAGGLN
jgi:hypothetical protein